MIGSNTSVNPHPKKMLRELREQKLNLSLRKFAKATGTDYTAIQRGETGQTRLLLSLSQVKALLTLMQKAGLDPVEDFPEN